MISAETKAWGPAISEELQRAGIPLPVELVLSVMDVESRGKAGLVNPKSGASGLLQVMPVVVSDYNKSHAVKVSMADMRGTSPQAAQKQIRVGVWILGQFWKGAYKYLLKRLPTVPTDELARIADLFYVAGPGATKRRLDKLSRPSYDGIRKRFSKWNALPHPKNVFSRLDEMGPQWRLDEIADWLHGAVSPPVGKRPVDGFLVAIIILMIGYYALKGKKDNEQSEKK